MKYRLLLALSAFVLFSSPVFSQESAFSAIRGRVLDRQSQFPLPGVSVILLGSEPLRGVATDPDGYFVLDKVPVGRQSIQVSFIGYEPRVFSNLLVFSGKELEVNVELEESVAMLEAVDVVAEEVKYEARNEMSTVSSRSFSVEEAMRYSGSLQDPARMAQNYAGVSNASDDRNDIIIRGNSPSGVLWRLEGIDIPSPNHFSSFGTTGGPVSMLNINNLANSDFITGAFAPEYGNALAGVFDLKLRSGNINKHEFLGQIGFNGFEFGAEGPIKIGNNASFLANYRYSTLEVFNALGLEFGTGSAVPQYQDLTFKVDIPTETAGRFTVFGIGGKSFIEFEASDATGQNLYSSDAENSQFGSDTYVAGFTHTYFFNEKWRSNFVVAASYAQTEGYVDSLSVEDASPVRSFGTNNVQSKYSANYSLNYKANSRNTFRAGVIADYYDVDIRDSVRTANGSFFSITDSRGETTLFQGHINWQHRWGERLTSNAGLHSQFLALNNSVVLEPRAGLRYKAGPRSTFSLAGGFHSQMQPLPVYFTRQRFEDGTSLLKNDRLDLTEASILSRVMIFC